MKKHHTKDLREFIHMIMYDVGIMMYQPGKISHTHFSCGNSDYGAKCGHSCNFKDMHENIPSCEECKVKLTKRDDNNLCSFTKPRSAKKGVERKSFGNHGRSRKRCD